MIDPNLMRVIIDGYALPVLGTHGLSHWARVLENGLRMAETTGANQRVVTLFAVFHDARRLNESIDPGHGARGGALAAELRDQYLDLSDPEFELLITACDHHTDGTVDGDVTVQTCWDADRLDLWRVRTVPKREYLCTPAACDREILEWSRKRSESRYTPDYVLNDWLAGRDI